MEECAAGTRRRDPTDIPFAGNPISKDDDFNLINEMARGCLYRGGESENNFVKGYVHAAIVIPGLFLVAYGVEVLLKWLF